MSTSVTFQVDSSNTSSHFTVVRPNGDLVLGIQDGTGGINFKNTNSDFNVTVDPLKDPREVKFNDLNELMSVDDWLPFIQDQGYDPTFLALSFYI